jgi:hypothetical protein
MQLPEDSPPCGRALGIFQGMRVEVQDFMCLRCGHVGRYLPQSQLERLREHVEGLRRPIDPSVDDWSEKPAPSDAIRAERNPLEVDEHSLTRAASNNRSNSHRPGQRETNSAPVGARGNEAPLSRRTPIRWFALDNTLGTVVWLSILLLVLHLIELFLGHNQ